MGPLSKVGTLTASIDLDVSRKLNWGKGLTLAFIVVDRTQLSGWRTLLTIRKGFDRLSGEEKTTKDGSEVLLMVADTKLTVGPILGTKDLHVRVDNITYGVKKIPPVAANEAQVFTLTCTIRPKRSPFDATKK